jgi:uncharacterized protein (TIGR02598 family)
MKRFTVPLPIRADNHPRNRIAIKLDSIGRNLVTYPNMKIKPPLHKASAFSLVEITLALGVAAFCLLTVFGLVPIALQTQQASVQQTTANAIMNAILGDLRADVRLPPGQASKENKSGFGLHGHWLLVSTPDTLYFTNQGTLAALDSTATFRAKITYLFPPVASTSVAKIIVSWPAQVDPATSVPAGSVETFFAINRG